MNPAPLAIPAPLDALVAAAAAKSTSHLALVVIVAAVAVQVATVVVDALVATAVEDAQVATVVEDAKVATVAEDVKEATVVVVVKVATAANPWARASELIADVTFVLHSKLELEVKPIKDQLCCLMMTTMCASMVMDVSNLKTVV